MLVCLSAAGGETVIVVKSATLVLADEEAGKQWVTTELTKRHENAILRKLVSMLAPATVLRPEKRTYRLPRVPLTFR